MNTECNRFRTLIPRSLLGDAGPEEKDALDRHVAECAPCRDEHALFLNTFDHLRGTADIPAPRHFFVYEEPGERRNPWWLWRRLPLVWQATLATATLAAGIFLAAAAIQLRVRADGHSLTIAFGALPATAPAAPAVPEIDTAALEARILSALEQRSRTESGKMLRTLREEVANSNRQMTGRQRALLQAALDSAESRMTRNLAVAMEAAQARNEKSLASVYEAVTLQQQRDRNVIENRIDRLAVSGEAKSSQTDAILQTLLEVAELRMK